MLQVPAVRSEESLVLTLLTDDHVLVHPGFFFDFAREAFLVVSLLSSRRSSIAAIRAGAGTRVAQSEPRCDRSPPQWRRRSTVLPRVDQELGRRASFADLPLFAGWLQSAGQSFVQLLPITEIPEAETSPYSSLTAMALDPDIDRAAATSKSSPPLAASRS